MVGGDAGGGVTALFHIYNAFNFALLLYFGSLEAVSHRLLRSSRIFSLVSVLVSTFFLPSFWLTLVIIRTLSKLAQSFISDLVSHAFSSPI